MNGYVLSAVHNIQPGMPVENIIACTKPEESMAGIQSLRKEIISHLLWLRQ
jgi:hypothetical protein